MTTANVEHQKLLLSLKGIVEGLLGHQISNVWNIYGGLNKLHWIVEKIFKNGFKILNHKEEADCWVFISTLSQLQPTHCQNAPGIQQKFSNLPHEIQKDKALLWIYRCLEEHTLSEKLQWLLSDSKHMENFYNECAFLRQKNYAAAAILCLRAVEQNQPSLLAEVDPSLYFNDLHCKKFHHQHKRCSSLPVGGLISGKSKISHENSSMRTEAFDKSAFQANTSLHYKRSTSLPNLNIRSLETQRIRTTSATTVSPSILNVSYSGVLKTNDRYNWTEEKEIAKSEKQIGLKKKKKSRREGGKEWFVVQGKKEERKKTFMEDGGTSVLPMSTGYFPRPLHGQSLTSFLSSEQFSRTSAELDRENAHFSISEAMISVIEQLKCNRQLKLIDDVNEDESDEEINRLKQRIRLRRRQKLEEKISKRQLWCSSLLSDGRTDTTTTDQSLSPLSTSPETPSESISTDGVDDFEFDDENNLKRFKNSELSVSMASLYSEADLSKTRRKAVEPNASAENVALSLLRQFKENQLPRASDLEWLVSEEDAPQELLPLPKSLPISPDDADNGATLLRGTSEWAPPRAQVIFTLHPTPVRRSLLSKQNYKCAGCGLRVAQEYSHKFRYCEYLGRYFCTGCHSNQLSIIPGRILNKWDFNRYPVSTFSYRLLDQMFTDPLFRLNDLNPELYKRIKHLERVRQLRLQLYYIKDFVFLCRFAIQVRDDFEREPSYIFNDPDMYSMQDLVQVRMGELRERLRDLIKDSISHIDDCQLCQARGFVCELCPSKEVIFPWLINKVSKCTKCGSCYHLQCFKLGFCPRCIRVNARRLNHIEHNVKAGSSIPRAPS